MDKSTIRDIGIITIIFLAATVTLYGYFIYGTKTGMQTVYRNWDGPAFAVIAKSLYDPTIINKVNDVQYIDYAAYFSQQYPLYPLFIRAFSFLGYDQSMIFVSVLFALLAILSIYFLVKMLEPTANARVIGLLCIFYMPRWFIVSHVGSAEPMFIFFLVLTWILLIKNKLLLSSVMLALAQLTRMPALFFFAGIGLYAMRNIRKIISYVPYLIVPLVLMLLFFVFQIRFGNYWTQMIEYGKHSIVSWPPFQNFTSPEGYYDIWKEGIFLIYVLYGVAISMLIQKKMFVVAVSSLPYFLYMFFIHHADISRYLLPLMPILAVAFASFLSKKSVYIPMFLGIPIIFMIAVSYMSYNVAGYVLR